jgi:prolyl oligopeptidase
MQPSGSLGVRRRTRLVRRTAAVLAVALLCPLGGAKDAGAPPTAQHDVVDTYYDTAVTDAYRWLEDAHDRKVRDWSLAQDRRTRRYLDGLPARKRIYDRLYRDASAVAPYFHALRAAGNRLFALYNKPPQQQAMIALLGSDADPAKARVVVDPNKINPKGTTAIDWFVPSPDGRLVAVSMSDNGSEDGTLHVFEVATGRELPDIIPRVQYPTGGGSLAWRADGKGFWYTRYPGPERPAQEQHFFQQVYFHVLGERPARDAYVIGKDFPKIAEISLDNAAHPSVLVVTVANGDGGEFAHYALTGQDHAVQLTRFEDKVVYATVGADDNVYLVSRQGAPRGRLLRLRLDDPVLAHAREIVPQSDAVIEGQGEFIGPPVVVTARALYVREQVGGPSRVAIFGHDGRTMGALPLPDPAAVSQVVALGDGTLLYEVATYLRPTYYSRYDEAAGKAADTRLSQKSPVSFDDAEVVREFATSADGTKVPLNIVRRKGTVLDGSHPVLLYGYGGFSISEEPGFLGAGTRLWLDAGGIFVDANLRGGGEYGEQWHADGALTKKQNVFDDFAAAARYLVDQKYTTPAQLAILGGSNGGLLMGAALTQHPEMFRAVVSEVGIYDMLRVELDPNGLFNTAEYGSVKDRAQFKALYAYSPYHHVVDGTHYPAILMATGETDGRVNPAHSRKMIARLQAATAGGPVYLSINLHAGHGIGSALSIRVGQEADEYAFLLDQLGMRLPPSAPARPRAPAGGT